MHWIITIKRKGSSFYKNQSMEEILYDKYYYESYALLTLKYYWSGYTEGFENLDKPDLQNKKANIGIEVVQALSEDEGMRRSRIIKFEEYENEISAEKAKRKIGFDFGNHFKEMIKRIDGKLEKLNNKIEDGYVLFDTNGLYIYAESAEIRKEDIIKMIPFIKKISGQYKRKFDIFFVNAIEKLCVIDEENNVQQIDFDSSVTEKMHSEALARSEVIKLLNEK